MDSPIETLIKEALDQQDTNGWSEFDLGSNPFLLQIVFEALAKQTGKLDTLEGFQKRFQSKPLAPTASDPKDPSLAPPRKWTSKTPEMQAKERIAWREYHYLKAQAKHEKDLQTYAKETERHRHIL